MFALSTKQAKWLRDSLIGRIFAASVLIAGLTTLVKVASLGKEMLVARFLGAGDALDAFYVAFLLPTFLIGIIAQSCNDAFIPTYIQVRESDGRQAAQRLFSNVAAIHLATLIALSLALAVLSPWLLPILGSGFGPSKLAMTRVLFFGLLSSLVLSGLSSLWRAVLNAHESFAMTAMAPVFIPAMIAFLLLIRGSTWRIYALVVGSVLGVGGEMSLNGYCLWRKGVSLVPRWSGFDEPVRRVLSQVIPAATAAALVGSTVIVDQAMAAMLGAGDVSALNYANKLIPTVLAIGSTSLSMAVFPALSKLCASHDWRAMRQVISAYVRIILFVSLPVTAILLASSEPLIRHFFERGAFTHANTYLVSRVQCLLGLEIPFYGICVLYSSAICALRRTSILMWGTAISVVINVMLDYVLMRLLGLPGIALATSIVYAVSSIYLGTMLERALKERETVPVETPRPWSPALESAD